MEKKAKLARTLSILGGIAFLVLAFCEILFAVLIASVYEEISLGNIIFNYATYVIAYTLCAVFLFVNKPRLMLIPLALLTLLAIMGLFNIPDFIGILIRTVYTEAWYNIIEKINLTFSWVIYPLFRFFAYATLIIASIFAGSKKSKAINFLWLIPVLFVAVIFVKDLVYEGYTFFQLTVDITESKESLTFSDLITIVFEIVNSAFSFAYFGGFFLLSLWLKVKNGAIRSQYAMVEDANYNGVQFQEPQPEYDAPQFEQVVDLDNTESYCPEPQPLYGQAQQNYCPDPQPAYQQAKVEDFEKIKKYKELLDQGIITREEFEKKKKELLDL